MYFKLYEQMKNFIAAFILIVCVHLGTLAQQKFTLKGDIANDAPYIYMAYTDSKGVRAVDSAKIERNKFVFKGSVNEPVMATIYLDKKIIPSNNADYFNFYLEPKNMTIKLQSGKFNDAVVTGSKTQEDWIELNASKAEIRAEMEDVTKEYNRLTDLYNKANEELKALDKKVKHLKEESFNYRENFNPFTEKMRQIDLAFIKNNPSSYISPYLIRFMTTGAKIDELEQLYGSLSDKVKASSYGKEIAKEITKKKGGSPGSKAFEFAGKDIDGKSLALTEFRGKYVLLDFWASWCVPCRKGNPHLIELYNKYKEKGFEVIGIADDDRTQNAWHKAVEDDQINIWKHILRGLKFENGKFDFSNSISDHFGISTLPTKILIDPQGIIIGRFAADASPDEYLDNKLKEIFNE